MRPSSLHDLAKALGGEVVSGRMLCPGPGHSAKDRSLSVGLDQDGRLSVHSFAGDDWQASMDDVRHRLGLPAFDPVKAQKAPRRDYRHHVNEEIERKNQEEKAAFVRRICAEAVDPRGTPVQAYLTGRGLILPEAAAGSTIRFHPACPWEGGERVPAMVCRYSPIVADLDPEAPPTAIHRTALRPDGSGHLGKKMLGATAGQCVKISPDEDVTTGLHIAEGIETSLAAYQRGWQPVWAATSAGCIQTFPVLDGIECLTILADHDQAGLLAAQTCAERWMAAGREVLIRWPDGIGDDYADEVRA